MTIQDGPEPFAVTVREVEGAERAEWWERAVAAFPPYAQYQLKTERRNPGIRRHEEVLSASTDAVEACRLLGL